MPTSEAEERDNRERDREVEVDDSDDALPAPGHGPGQGARSDGLPAATRGGGTAAAAAAAANAKDPAEPRAADEGSYWRFVRRVIDYGRPVGMCRAMASVGRGNCRRRPRD